MKRMIILIIAGIVFLLSSCKETAPGFPEQMKSYLPYNDDDVILYTSNKNDTMQFFANNIYFSKSHKHSSGCKCGYITELYGNMESEELIIDYIVTCDESNVDIKVIIKQEENITNIYSKLYPYNAYAENIINLIGDTITLQCAKNNYMVLAKDKGIIYYYIDNIKYQMTL